MTSTKTVPIGSTFSTDVPTRLDRLPWSNWHWRLVIALGVTWIFDGLEATIIGALSEVLKEPETLGLTETQIGLADTAYLIGAIVGALFFGYLTDKYGRKKLFLVTLSVYLVSTFLTALSPNFALFAIFRLFTGAGIGGEYSAINSAVDELIPARLRGRVDLAINSTYWLGAAMGAGATLILLNERIVPHALGWRICFGMGGVIGLCIVLVRRHVPESPRWLLMNGRVGESDATVTTIERFVKAGTSHTFPTEPAPELSVKVTGSVGFKYIIGILLRKHLRRTILGLTLMIAQAFFYNAIFFTYAMILGKFYGVPSSDVGLYLLPFAAGNLLGPLLLGPLFDIVGRRAMIIITYALSGLLLAITGYAFKQGVLTATSQTVLWSITFFVASAAASSAYLTVSELFPVELRGLAIAIFYAVGTLVGGAFAPTIFAILIESNSRDQVFLGYLAGSLLMIAAAIVAYFLAVAAEGKSLEELADHDPEVTPLMEKAS